MRTSTKIMGAALVVAAGGAAAAPLITAGVAEQRMRHIAEVNPFEQSPHVDWVLNEYESDYLHARATSELTFHSPAGGKSFTIVLDHDIDHALAAGNSLLRIRTVPRIPEGQASVFAEQVLGDRDPLTIDYRMRLDGTSVAQVSSPSSEGMREIDYGAVEWQGLEGKVTVSADQQSLTYDFELPGLRVEPRTGDVTSATLGMTRLRGAFEESAFDRIWVGGGSATIDHLRADGAPDGSVSMSGIEISEEVSIQNDLLGARIHARVGEIVGPKDRLTNMLVDLSANRIPPDLLYAGNDLRLGLAGVESEGERRRIRREILDEVPWDAVIRAEPAFVVETFQANTEGGAISASGKAGLMGPTQIDAAQFRASDLASHGYAEVSLRAPQAVVVDFLTEIAMAGADEGTEADAQRTTMQRLQMMQGQGWLQAGEGDYFTTASYERGMIRINGSSLFGMGGG